MPTPPLHPAHPERTCWGCDRYCPADQLACGNGSIRAQHPCELFGPDWCETAIADSAPRRSGAETPSEPDATAPAETSAPRR